MFQVCCLLPLSRMAIMGLTSYTVYLQEVLHGPGWLTETERLSNAFISQSNSGKCCYHYPHQINLGDCGSCCSSAVINVLLTYYRSARPAICNLAADSRCQRSIPVS